MKIGRQGCILIGHKRNPRPKGGLGVDLRISDIQALSRAHFKIIKDFNNGFRVRFRFVYIQRTDYDIEIRFQVKAS
jgi:hypothetical protein